MTGPPTVDIHVDNRLTRTSCPLSPCLSALFQKISTSSDKHLRHGTAYAGSSAFWKAFKKPVAPAGYKNKQCRKQTSVLSGRIVTAYVPLRSATERERAAFLIPCQGLRDYFTNSQVTEQLKLSISILHTSFRGENAQKQYRRFDDNIQTSDKFQEISCNRFVNVLSSNYSNGNVTGNNTDTDSETVTGTYKNYEVTRTNIKER